MAIMYRTIGLFLTLLFLVCIELMYCTLILLCVVPVFDVVVSNSTTEV